MPDETTTYKTERPLTTDGELGSKLYNKFKSLNFRIKAVYVGYLSSKYIFHNILGVCKELTLSSSGPAGDAQSKVMGKFLKVNDLHHERSVWRRFHNGETEWIYYVKFDGVWLVSFWVCSN